MDQELAKIRDGLPRLWFALYEGCKAAGFEPSQSLSLVQVYILSQCPGGIQPNNPPPPKKEDD